MAIERKFDSLGRVVIPKEMRDRIGIDENTVVSISQKGNEIILKNNVELKTINEIKEKIDSHKKSNTDYYRGYKDALKWVMNEK